MILSWRSPLRLAAALWRAFWWFCHGRPVIAPEKVRFAREIECQYCEHRIRDQCGKCLCLVDTKIMLSSEECPDEPPRWRRLTIRPNSGHNV